MAEEFNNPKLDKIFQIGILVKNLDEVKKNYEELLGIGPWTEPGIMSGKNMELYINGQRFEDDFFKVTMLHRYGFEIELIEPIGDTPLKAWVEKHGNGLHHVDFRLNGEEYEDFLKKAGEITGKDTWLRGTGFGGRMDFSYIDMTEELGMYVEVKPDRPNHDGTPRPGFDY